MRLPSMREPVALTVGLFFAIPPSMEATVQKSARKRGFRFFCPVTHRLVGVPFLAGLFILVGLMIFTGCATSRRDVFIVIPDAEDALEAEAASEDDEALDALRRQVDDLSHALKASETERDALIQGSRRLEEQRAAAVAELERLQQQSVEQEQGEIDASGALHSLELSQGWRAEQEGRGQEREALQSEIDVLRAKWLAVTEGQVQGAALPEAADSDRIAQGTEGATVQQATEEQAAGADHKVGLPEEGRSLRGRLWGWFRGSSPAKDAEQLVLADVAGITVQPGNEIKVEVFREPDLSGEFTVGPDGAIRHPVMGSLVLAGLSVKEAEAKIVAELAEHYLVDPRVIFTLKSGPNARIVVLGEVNRPGVYPYPTGETITMLEAIANAGGLTDMASRDRIRLVRSRNGRSESYRIRVSRMLSGREPDVPLQPNDVITVPEVRF